MLTVSSTLTDVLSKVQAALNAQSISPKRVFVSDGTQAVIDECCAGVLWVRLDSVVRNLIPIASGGAYCYTESLAVIEVGYANCSAVPDDYGNPPSPDQITSDAMSAITELQIIEEVLQNYSTTRISGGMSWSPLDTEGGCAGGTWLFTVEVC